MIVKQVQFSLDHYRAAEPALRRWDLIVLAWLRVSLMLGLLLAWFAVGDWMSEQQFRRMGLGLPHRAPIERIYAFGPYVLWIPAIFWGLHRARILRRKAWFEQVQAAGIREVEFGGAGIALRSDSARHFYRWDGIQKIRERPSVLVVFLNRALALVIPTMDATSKEMAQITAWKKDFAARGSLLDSTAARDALTFRVQVDHADYREVLKLERRARTKTSLLVRRWATIGILTSFILALFFMASWGPHTRIRDAFWYWSTFGTPGFLLVILLYSLGFAWFLRWQRWRDVGRTITRDKLLRFTDDGVEVRSEVEAHLFNWRAFIGIEVGKRTIDLRLAGGGTIIIPLRQTPGESAAFIEYLRRHVVNVTQAFPVEMGIRNLIS